MRLSHDLCEGELDFRNKRKEKAFEGLRKFLGDQGPRSLDEVPNIAVIGSGGGFRAMVGYSGVFKGLSDSGLLDSTMYACGLSGSSWYLSTLYSHPKWPDMNPGDLQDELKHNIDKSMFCLLKNIFGYLRSIKAKQRQGHTVSLTDLFGLLLGDTLLNERQGSKLTDQVDKIREAKVPMPLYPGIYVKDVPTSTFHEWIEFSPFEIGMATYGAFLASEEFDSEFFTGKLLRKYDEQPLYFLQGVWGSAFTVLSPSLKDFGEYRGMGPAQIIRLEMEKNSKLETARCKSTANDCLTADAGVLGSAFTVLSPSVQVVGGCRVMAPSQIIRLEMERNSQLETARCKSTANDHLTVEAGEPSDNSDTTTSYFPCDKVDDQRDDARTPDNEIDEEMIEAMLLALSEEYGEEVSSLAAQHGNNPPITTETLEIMHCKEILQLESVIDELETVFVAFLKKMFEIFGKCCGLLKTRAGRAAVINNFTRAVHPEKMPDTQNEGDKECNSGIDDYTLRAKEIYVVDAGIAFNSPYPLVLRPERQIDVILSFDFSAREKDTTPPFEELYLAEEWARKHNLPFPAIPKDLADLREMYVFEGENCPVVLHFPLVNMDFQKYKAPGVPRKTEEEIRFGDFAIFDEPGKPYSTFNFQYTHQQFERLAQLMEFNVLNNLGRIREVVAAAVASKRKNPQ